MAGAKEVYYVPDHRLQDDSALLALPDSFHDGSLWEQPFVDSSDSE